MDNNTDRSSFAPQPIAAEDGSLTARKKRKKSPWISVVLGTIGCLFGLAGISLTLYNQALLPVDSKDSTSRTVEIVSGSTPQKIGEILKQEGVIRHELAFAIYTRLHGVQNQLQAGVYSLSPSQSTKDIVATLVKGVAEDEFEVTFLPGATLADSKKVLLQAGFREAEIDEAFTATYDHPLFVGRPAAADIEGYLFGETHRFVAGTSLDVVLKRFFDDFYAVVKEEDLEASYKRHGLTLYEGITLASIVQKEVSDVHDSRQVAQVFYKRLAEGISLGADATFVYAAKKAGEAPRVDYPSPYNTRLHSGLPPGPIAIPGVGALRAVADPASGDYLYFVSGDDGKNYFSETQEEHIRKTREYCKKNCALF